MTTSGTVATTVIDTAKLIEHAVRRVGLAAAIQTPEIVQIAKESLYMLLLSLANRGLNLWCVEKQFIGLETGRAFYDTPAGTIDLLNVIYSQATRAAGTDSSTATSATTQLDTSTTIYRIGVQLSAVAASDTLVLSSSPDGVVWTTRATETRTDWTTSGWYWFELDPPVDDVYFRASFTNSATFSEFYLASDVVDLPVSQWNRDTYAVMTRKEQQGRPSTNYFFDKQLTPRVALWPTPNNNYDHLTVWRHRQVQDIGSLTQQLDVPQRWVEDIVWQLALRIGFELPGVDPARLKMLSEMAEKHQFEAELEETDGADTTFDPGIAGYTA